MTDKIPSFKEEIDNIHVPFEKLDAIITGSVQMRVPKRKRSLQSKFLFGVGAATVALGLLVGSATFSPVMASFVSQIPVLGSIFSESREPGLKQVSDLGLSQLVGESQIVDDMKLTIDEVYYDGTRFTVGYSLESEKALGDIHLSPRLSVNSEPIGSNMNIELNDITPTFQSAILNINAPENLPEAFELDLNFQISDGKQWDFTIPVRTQTNMKQFTINEKQEFGGITLTVSELKMSPAGLLLTFDKSYDQESKDTGFHFLADHLTFKIVDDLGNEIASRSGSSEGQEMDGKVYWTGSLLYDPIDDNLKELTIIPFLDLPKREIDANGKEKEIDHGEYNLEDIKFDSIAIKLK
ncbi:DUF4179 domain-containing protein [Lederbergia lenta]|uniref:DUF4179 domain-containing protein n=1 Tax=Lederbergia lenta TaxID=1467 RepID=UPI00203C0D67|nr:DUF4179 domain-containing protein [Lederbergia lenta]MCM3111321.1 DUF4179 domain-containing protein [Lederbergia lenta]